MSRTSKIMMAVAASLFLMLSAASTASAAVRQSSQYRTRDDNSYAPARRESNTSYRDSRTDRWNDRDKGGRDDRPAYRTVRTPAPRKNYDSGSKYTPSRTTHVSVGYDRPMYHTAMYFFFRW